MRKAVGWTLALAGLAAIAYPLVGPSSDHLVSRADGVLDFFLDTALGGVLILPLLLLGGLFGAGDLARETKDSALVATIGVQSSTLLGQKSGWD